MQKRKEEVTRKQRDWIRKQSFDSEQSLLYWIVINTTSGWWARIHGEAIMPCPSRYELCASFGLLQSIHIICRRVDTILPVRLYRIMPQQGISPHKWPVAKVAGPSHLIMFGGLMTLQIMYAAEPFTRAKLTAIPSIILKDSRVHRSSCRCG